MKPLYKTGTAEYWHDFTVNSTDLDHLYEFVLAEGQPCSPNSFTLNLIKERCKEEVAKIASRRKGKVSYQPAESYTVGQRLSFAALRHRTGEVLGIRQGNNPRYGLFEVISVRLQSPVEEREFASAFPAKHPLNLPVAPKYEAPQAEEIMAQYGGLVQNRLIRALRENEEYVSFDNLWLLKDLLLEIHLGHLNIAEAMIDINGMPHSPEELTKEMEALSGAAPLLQQFSLNCALAQDERFINVGTEESPLWHLVRLTQEGQGEDE